MGASSDFQIFHNGTNNYIKNATSDQDLIIQGNDGGSIISALTLDMSNGGQATFNKGITVNDHVYFGDNDKAVFGASDDLQIYHDGSNSRIHDAGTGDLLINAQSNIVLGALSGEEYLRATENGAVSIKYDNATKLATTSGGVTVTGTVAATSYTGDGSNLTGISDTNTTYSAGGGLSLSGTTFSINSDQRNQISSFGSSAYDFISFGSGLIDFKLDGNIDMRLENDGDLHVDGNVIAYSTTISDERLKKDIVKIDNALDKVGQLNGYTFEYLKDGRKSAGIIAQEVEKVMPSAVTETTLPIKMGEDDKNLYKVVQYDQLHGLMIEAIKELKAEVETLKGK
jgi:hypothetical protein